MRRVLRGFPALLLVLSALVIPAGVSLSGFVPGAAKTSSASGPVFHAYRVTVAQPNEMVKVEGSVADLETQAKQRRNDAISALLTDQQKAGAIQSFSYEASSDSFLVTASDAGVAALSADPRVAAVRPSSPAPSVVPAAKQAPSAPNALDVSTVNYLQVYSPFMWGKVHSTGVTVTITLEDGSSNVLGVPVQTTEASLNHQILVDPAQNYYETVFVNPSNPSQSVMIEPNDVVRVVSSGLDSSTTVTLTKTIPVDDVQAWTSYLNDTVTGHTSLANHTVYITVGTGVQFLSSYLQDAAATYAQTSSDANGNFSAATFRTQTSATYNKVDLKQDSTGFVRVVHDDGNEVYTYHGQNVLPLENSGDLHGYAFPAGLAPAGLANGVAVTRPLPTVSITQLDSNNKQKASVTLGAGFGAPSYSTTVLPTIVAGDTFQVSINGGPVSTITMPSLTAAINLGTNQVSGTGPLSASLTLGVGRIDGYMTRYMTFNYVQQQVSTSNAGSFTSSTISCGTSGNQILQPGSFGYLMYEDSHGNSPYLDFAAPRTDVMPNFPYLEGWMAIGTSNPEITLKDSLGNVKSPQTPATPVLYWLDTQLLYLNTFYNQATSQFIAAGDTVTVSQTLQSGAPRTDTVSVDNLTTYVNTDDDTIVGTAPAGATLRTIPFLAKSSYQTAIADTTGNYTIANPFLTYIDSTCSTISSTQAFSPGSLQSAGRTYLAHADGNQVFAAWGRSMHIAENSTQIELDLFPTQNIDILSTPTITSTVVVTPQGGVPASYTDPTTSSLNGYLKVTNLPVPIQSGASVTISFVEGPPSGPLRPATISLGTVPLITAAPDFKRNTLAGVGPVNWTGAATMTAPTGASPIIIGARSSSAWGPFSFSKAINQGDTFNVSFTDRQSDRVWNAWTATTYPIEISPPPKVGDPEVCGTAQPNVGVKLINVSDGINQISIGQPPNVAFPATANSSGNFCITVDPAQPLYRFEVLQVVDSNGTYSQPVSVAVVAAYLPVVFQ
jgi:hypothetical protein